MTNVDFFIHLRSTFSMEGRKMKKIAILLGAMLMFSGCAMDSKSKMSEANMMQENLLVYGAYKAEIAGQITMEEKDRCNKASFLLFARKNHQMDKVVDIIMKETCYTEAGTTDQRCSCEYSGIGMKYKELDVKEMLLWKTGETVKEEETVASDTTYAETSSSPDLSAEQMIP